MKTREGIHENKKWNIWKQEKEYMKTREGIYENKRRYKWKQEKVYMKTSKGGGGGILKYYLVDIWWRGHSKNSFDPTGILWIVSSPIILYCTPSSKHVQIENCIIYIKTVRSTYRKLYRVHIEIFKVYI